MNSKGVSRRTVLQTMGAGIPSLAFTNWGQAASTKKNVLFIAVDDLRPQLGCYGHQQMISPNIDALASSGIIFENSFCNVPVCGASRASVMTGVRPTRNRFLGYNTWKDQDLPDAVSLPMQFKTHGYHTISNGKVYHHNTDDRAAWSEEPWRPKGDWAGRGYLDPKNKAIAKERKGIGPAYEYADVSDDAYPDGKIADKTIADLRRMKEQKKPFFLAAGFLKPHLPFVAPQKYWDYYKHDKINLASNPFAPKNAPSQSLHNWGELRQYAGIPQKGPLSDEMARWMVHGYYACVSYTDAQIGRVLSELDRLGLRDDTVIILWGDHGWNLGEHGLWCKHCNYKTSLRTPMLVSAPGYAGGQRTQRLTEYVDIYPSLCELCGIPVPETLDGTSFVPLMKQPDRAWKKAVFSRFHAGETIKTVRYSYTEYRAKDGTLQARMLYDHKVDPQENENIAEKPENKELVQSLSKRLKEGQRSKVKYVPQKGSS